MSNPFHSSSPIPAKRAPLRRYRVDVAARVAMAAFGGYFVAYACTALLTVILPMSRINRVMTASLLSFVVWCAVVIWVFSARSAWRGCWPMLALGAAMLGVALTFADAGTRP